MEPGIEIFEDSKENPAFSGRLQRGRRLSFGGLRKIGHDLAAVLVTFPKGLHLDGLREVDVPMAEILARWDGWGEKVLLSLGGLETLEPGVARALAACRGWGVALNGLQTLSPDAARELAALDNPFLSLDGLRSLPMETAEAISHWKRKFLTLDGLTEMDPAARRLVEKGTEAVSFRSLRE